MEKLFKFDYFHVIIDEVTFIGSQGSRFFPGDGIGTLARIEEEKSERREEKCAPREIHPAIAHGSRGAGEGMRFLRGPRPLRESRHAITVQAMGEVVN